MKEYVQIALLVVISGLQLARYFGHAEGRTEESEATTKSRLDRIDQELRELKDRMHKHSGELTRMPYELKKDYVTQEVWTQYTQQVRRDISSIHGAISEIRRDLRHKQEGEDQ